MENQNIKLVGFEPAQGPLYYFRENVSINNIKNIKVESIALSHKEGEIELHWISMFHEIRKPIRILYPIEKGLVKQTTIVRQFENGLSNCFFVHSDKFH